MPRKEKMISRTVEVTDVTVMYVELDDAEIFDQIVTIEGNWVGKPQKEILNVIEDRCTPPDARIKPVEVLNMEVVAFKYVMPLSRFIDYATDCFKVDEGERMKEEI